MWTARFCYKKKLFINSGLEYSHTLASLASLDGPRQGLVQQFQAVPHTGSQRTVLDGVSINRMVETAGNAGEGDNF